MLVRVFVALLLLAVVLPMPTEAIAAPKACVAATATCTFACSAGDVINILVVGAGSVSGVATCGSATARCNGTDDCEGSAFTFSSSALGKCDLTRGTTAICWSEPSPQAG